MTARAPNGRFTAERTTTVTTAVTEQVTERITVENYGTIDTWADGTIPGPIHRAPGWDADLLAERHAWREQRARQVWRAAEIVVAAADPFLGPAPLRPLDRGTLQQVVNILRAGPAATPLELTTGRSI